MTVAADPIVRIYFEDEAGVILDPSLDLSIDVFAGYLPQPGDLIVDPYGSLGLAASEDHRGETLEVINRVFNPKELLTHVALVVRRRFAATNSPWV